jgi:S1-C subfamily serine protease
LVIYVILALGLIVHPALASLNISVSGPISADFSGKGGYIAFQSVVRVYCLSNDSAGTGFFHKSGKIITAEHVVFNCDNAIIIGSNDIPVKVTEMVMNSDLDLALLTVGKGLQNPSLNIGTNDNVTFGLQVSTWGFPSGYNSRAPMLSVGYLSGVGQVETRTGKQQLKWVVNAAFNLGNSGGPLLNIDTGEVIGVVSSKLAPIPKEIEGALNALAQNKFGFMYTYTHPDGKKDNMSEGQVVAIVLNHLRSQVQLVVGHAVMLRDIRSFLQSRGIDP